MNRPIAKLALLLTAVMFFACSKEESCMFFGKCDEEDDFSSSSDEEQTLSSSSIKADNNPSSSSGGNTLSSSSIPASDVGPLTDSRDAQTYKTVVIGSQTWMAENLNYNANGSKCYNNTASNCSTYGKLYDWSTAMGFDAGCNQSECADQIDTPHKGICPSGWHIPSITEWSVLAAAVGGENIAGAKLKAKSGWNNGGNGSDEFGFSAMPGGTCMPIMSIMDYFDLVRDYGYWWTADENGSNAMFQSISYNEDGTDFYDIDKSIMMSVRCLKDKN